MIPSPLSLSQAIDIQCNDGLVWTDPGIPNQKKEIDDNNSQSAWLNHAGEKRKNS